MANESVKEQKLSPIPCQKCDTSVQVHNKILLPHCLAHCGKSLNRSNCLLFLHLPFSATISQEVKKRMKKARHCKKTDMKITGLWYCIRYMIMMHPNTLFIIFHCPTWGRQSFSLPVSWYLSCKKQKNQYSHMLEPKRQLQIYLTHGGGRMRAST